jgi:integrase
MGRYTEVPAYKDILSYLAECKNPYWNRIAKALYFTGARAGELVKIQSQHIIKDKENPSFIQVKLLTEKNPHAPVRYIPINIEQEPDALEVFAVSPNPNALCFTPENDVSTNSFLRYMRKEFNKVWNVAPHYFRHTRLTHFITEFDFNEMELVKYAGWTDSKPAKWYVSLKTNDLQRKMM